MIRGQQLSRNQPHGPESRELLGEAELYEENSGEVTRQQQVVAAYAKVKDTD